MVKLGRIYLSKYAIWCGDPYIFQNTENDVILNKLLVLDELKKVKKLNYDENNDYDDRFAIASSIT